ncbi:MAG: Gfo/Idh/MocA family oxidoreductase [Lachnospiraceae bacterium]|nr:Gfo/Idh/MocA family oxidoreductase [Lachnospiraceae bacterium]
MGKIKICIIGAGNISNTRHIPAILQNEDMQIVGIISDEKKKIVRTVKNHPCLKNCHMLVINQTENVGEQLHNCEWFKRNVDAVIIGTPPKQHYPMVKASLALGKHVLVEKPMMMNEQECDEVLLLAQSKQVILYVMHSFQFSKGVTELYNRYSKGELGKVKSILEIQLTNRNRRLPVWYNELPLGLYYDEAAHFFYCARRFGGKLKVQNAHAVFNDGNDNTPRFLEAQLKAGEIPVQMYMNFNSPICEWGLIIIGEKKIAIYDYFKDILIVLKNDNQHYAKDVLRTSLSFFRQFWWGFFKNGIKMIRGKLLYGHDECIARYAKAIKSKENCFELSGELGKEVVQAMNVVIEYAKKDE